METAKEIDSKNAARTWIGTTDPAVIAIAIGTAFYLLTTGSLVMRSLLLIWVMVVSVPFLAIFVLNWTAGAC
jgi:hypothetical protein